MTDTTTHTHTASDTDDAVRRNFPPIQLLIPSFGTSNGMPSCYTWLHGYCLLTITPLPKNNVLVRGEVRIGERYAENPQIVKHLADALDPDCVLAGYGLDDMIAMFGRLPIGADQPDPGLAVLEKLKAMLENWLPMDVGCDEEAREIVRIQAEAHELTLTDAALELRTDNAAVALADKAGACALTLAELYMPDWMHLPVLCAWHNWRTSHLPVLPVQLKLVAGGEEAEA